MTRNPFRDGEPFSSAILNSMNNAHANEGILEGVGLSAGAGDWDVDVSAGVIVLDDSIIDVGADTVTVTSSSAEDRLDLISVDETGAISVTAGSPASEAGQPDAPDIPNGEAVAGLVYVRGGSSEILSGDLYAEYQTVISRTPPGLVRGYPAGHDPNFGDVQQINEGHSSASSSSTLADIDGPGVLLGGMTTYSGGGNTLYLTIDGEEHAIEAAGVPENDYEQGSLPIVYFEDSLVIVGENTGGQPASVRCHAWVKTE